jgi:hypothetical protein
MTAVVEMPMHATLDWPRDVGDEWPDEDTIAGIWR